MFVKACEEAAKFTKPVVVSCRRLDGKLGTSLGAFVLVNPEGWIVSAGHMMDLIRQGQDHGPHIRSYDAKVAEILASNADVTLQQQQIEALPRNDEWLRNVSSWWGQDGAQLVEWAVYPQLDLMVGRLQGFRLSDVAGFPTFKLPGNIKAGTSIVTVGYPFQSVQCQWDETTQTFTLDTSTFPLFPMDGIHTRVLLGEPTPEGFPAHFLQTSSPGLRGQSGGPMLDKDGLVYSIQSHTVSLPLGFRPKANDNGREVEEHQFLNLGVGVHATTLEAVFQHHGITAQWAP